MKKWLYLLFSSHSVVSSKRVSGMILLLSSILLLFINSDFTDNKLSIIKLVVVIGGILVSGGSIETVLTKLKK